MNQDKNENVVFDKSLLIFLDVHSSFHGILKEHFFLQVTTKKSRIVFKEKKKAESATNHTNAFSSRRLHA